MKSLETAFKQVYTEVLEPYGFQKIKGKRPYFVRMVGDEILHVITVRPEPTIMPGERRFGIYGGVATVYRPQIKLDIPPRDNEEWLTNSHMIYRDTDIFSDRPDRFKGKYNKFFYIRDNEESLVSNMEKTVDSTCRVLLKQLDKVTDFEACIAFLNEFCSSVLIFIDDGEFGRNYLSNEGLVNFKVFHRFGEYAEYRKKEHEKYEKKMLYMMEKGMIGLSMESFQKMQTEGEEPRKRRLETFKKYLDNEQNHKMVMEEMERRKKENLEILRGYGLNV